MEAGDVGARQSGLSSARTVYYYNRPPQQQFPDSQYRDTMATAALMSPSTPYGHSPNPGHHNHGQPQSHAAPAPSYPHAMSNSASISGMISPVEPRRPSADSESSHRQSLPSISEVMSANPAPPPYTSTSQHGHAHGPSSHTGSSFPSPFTPRTFESQADKNPSPRIVQPTSTYPPRQEPLPTYPDASRPAPLATARSGVPPPLSSYSSQPSPPIKHDQPPLESDKAPEHHINGAYSSHAHAPPPPPPPHHPHYAHPSQQAAPPMHGYPVSPNHIGPPLPSPYEQRPMPRPEEQDFAGRRGYDTTVHRHFEAWGYQDCLNRIAATARTIFNFSEAYARIAQEQNTQRPIPERLPSEREVSDMLNNVDLLKRSLDGVRDLVQQSLNNDHRGNKSGKHPYEEDDANMYPGEASKPAYMSEGKKRRGRAAPPGRCHSCNRIDTPEWRRGPDGARTLCNACGLHYAKLERKRQLEARSIRPKPADERS